MKKFVNKDEIQTYLSGLHDEFAAIKNADYLYPPYEFSPLAKKITTPRKRIAGVVMDMDGTTTTTETLCLHSLEFMVGQSLGETKRIQWQGLDKTLDYPHIIGNSTTRHVEYLIEKYKSGFDEEALKNAYLKAALWFLLYGKDQKRVAEVKNNLNLLGCKKFLQNLQFKNKISKKEFKNFEKKIVTEFKDQVTITTFSDYVRIGIDVYYQRYHEILSEIQSGNGKSFAQALNLKADQHLIEPMPGVGEFIALVKGWLNEEIGNLLPQLVQSMKVNGSFIGKSDESNLKDQLIILAQHFQKTPAKIAVVTSSIFYEAKIVLNEVYRVLVDQVQNWPILKEKKDFLIRKFSDYHNIYDGFVTASDSNEIRLKPHRDLYSIALHQLGIAADDFENVIGFEDSESGTIAIRSAGIGLCCAVPFVDTSNHDLQAATYILKDGLPEAVLKHNVFLEVN